MSDEEKEGKLGVLGHLSKVLSEKDHEMIGAKKKPVAAEVSVTTASPLEEAMKSAGHEGVESAESKLFPEEQAKEGEGSGENQMLGGEGGKPSPEELALIKDLYHQYFG